MNFYLIKNVDDDANVAGVIIESAEGLLGARLTGDKGVSDPAKLVPELLKRTPEQGFPVEEVRGTSRVVTHYRPGQPGFARALLQQLRPPLRFYLQGDVPVDDTPEELTRRLWRMFNTDGERREMPPNYQLLN
jgi:hypothetical protein